MKGGIKTQNVYAVDVKHLLKNGVSNGFLKTTTL